MGEAKRRKQTDPTYGQPRLSTAANPVTAQAGPTLPGLAELDWNNPRNVWERIGSKDDPMVLFAKLVKSVPLFDQDLWNQWKTASQTDGTSKIVGIFHANCPHLPNPHIEFVTFRELQQQQETYALSRSMLADFDRYFKLFDWKQFSSTPDCLPPFLVVWYDGKTDGDFVSQPCLTMPAKAAGTFQGSFQQI